MPSLTDEALARAMILNGRLSTPPLGWDRYVDAIGVMLGAPGVRVGDAALALAVATWQDKHQLAVDGVIGPKTWSALRLVLASPDTPTGIVPAGAPPVPDGFEAIVATFGDPRPLRAPDGTITPDHLALWERQTLARGHTPFPVPTAGGVVQTFHCHRLLVGVFEAVFEELSRLGLRGAIHSWDGIYNFRSIRGATRLSLHAFGAAIDLNAATNQRGTEGDMSTEVIAVFRHFGFLWGGDFHALKDPMHFQYATGY